ncbi:magnesium-translocating P-type ATPase [Chitinophaga pollutisoli]|uniref:Magnesium-transporting ATPase, P-type 1 n=1 Tax=Chitinophaga pollutisoli TaxID=3133966 RepID=A0ABZ2YM03_9BACT
MARVTPAVENNWQFSDVPMEQLFQLLGSSEGGLTAESADRKAAQLRSPKNGDGKKTALRLLSRQFSNPLILLLVIAAILSAVLGEKSEAFIILLILMITGLLGFWQEFNAGRAISQLMKMVELTHTVMRDGNPTILGASAIVPGDVMLLAAGDIIPADCRILESEELYVNESTLTGETYPVEKFPGQVPCSAPLSQKHNCLWEGSSVISGRAKALVALTGGKTMFGQLKQSLRQPPETAFEKGIRRFGYFLLRITIILAFVILLANLWFRKPFFDAVLFSLALSVGMAPELLPAIMTFSMAAGARRMMKKQVIVKKLSSIFNFGEMNVLCTDKTGTITEGTAKVADVLNADGMPDKDVRFLAWLNAFLQNGLPNPIDQSVATLFHDVNGYEKINEVPYDFVRKRLTVAVRRQDDCLMVTKGAFSNVLDICTTMRSPEGLTVPFDAEAMKAAGRRFIGFSELGFRVLAVAIKNRGDGKITREDEHDMTFAGYILLEDPLKLNIPASIEKLKRLNTEVKIITGDNRHAAAHTAAQLGMPHPVTLTGDEIDRLSPESLVIRVRQTSVFSETEPRQKERIIKALQRSGLTVAYLGDGINDVAAIHAADIGISTSNAVGVAKDAADFVCLEKDLSILADGITEGRKSFANSMKYVFITTGATFGNMMSVACSSLFLPFLPMLPKQILLTNLISDFPFLSIASDRVDEAQLIAPGRWNLKQIQYFMLIFGLHSSLFDFAFFYIFHFRSNLSPSLFQTGWFLVSVISEILIIFVVRTRKSVLGSKPAALLLLTGAFALLVTIFMPISPFARSLGLTPMHSRMTISITLLLATYFITAEMVKLWFFRSRTRQAKTRQSDVHSRPD